MRITDGRHWVNRENIVAVTQQVLVHYVAVEKHFLRCRRREMLR